MFPVTATLPVASSSTSPASNNTTSSKPTTPGNETDQYTCLACGVSITGLKKFCRHVGRFHKQWMQKICEAAHSGDVGEVQAKQLSVGLVEEDLASAKRKEREEARRAGGGRPEAKRQK
jgi:hypothetical protein